MKKLFFVMAYFVGTSLHSAESQPVCIGKSEICKQLNAWYEEGNAAGNKGDYYDNRDRDHSRIKVEKYPQLSEVQYSFDERSQNKDWAGQHKILPHVTIGNSSTAGKLGSNARANYYTSQEGMEFLHSQYRNSNLYIYPEHKDYDPVSANGRNDVIPTNTPYLILSKGSSGSDKPFIDAFIKTLAAFDPVVKTTLINSGLLMPTLQQIFRMSNSTVQNREDYLTGKAHPPVFDGKNIQLKKMVEAAHGLTLDKIPPLVNLKELTVNDGSPSFHITDKENIATTPEVIAKIYRGIEPQKKLIVTAKDSQDLFSRPLQLHWVVLSGNKNAIEIETTDDGKTAEITVPHQHPFVIDDASGLKSSRIDIGVFADNGISLSAPAFITVFVLPNELRTYGDDGKIKEIFYAASEKGFTINSWSELLASVSNKAGSFPTELLQENFSPQQIAFFREQQPTIEILEKDVMNAQAELKGLQDLRKKVGTKLVPYSEIQSARKKLNESQHSLQQMLSKKQSILNNHSIKEDLLEVMHQYTSDLTFYNREKASIESLAEGKEQQLHKLIGRLNSEGIIEKKPQDLTEYERQELEALNLYIFTHILYPSSLSMWVKPNYVDPRLATPQKVLRRFEYDENGKKIGQNDRQVH